MSELFFDSIYIINLKRQPDKLRERGYFVKLSNVNYYGGII